MYSGKKVFKSFNFAFLGLFSQPMFVKCKKQNATIISVRIVIHPQSWHTSTKWQNGHHTYGVHCTWLKHQHSFQRCWWGPNL